MVPSGALEPNCKANYQSVMNYLFQVRGLLTPDGVPTIDLSRQELPALSEAALAESTGSGPPTPYLPSWYAPASASYIDTALHITPATRRCDGSPVAATDPAYVRIDGDPRLGAGLDWNADGRSPAPTHRTRTSTGSPGSPSPARTTSPPWTCGRSAPVARSAASR